MKKEEIIGRIINAFTGMGSESPEDIALTGGITLDEARKYLIEARGVEAACFEPEDKLFTDEVTPELYMEAYNCYVRKCKHDITIERLVIWLTDNNDAILHDEYCSKYNGDEEDVILTDCLNEDIDFPWELSFDCGENGIIHAYPNMLGLLILGQRSANTFNSNHLFCWYDKKENVLRSTDTPYADHLWDAYAFAEYILINPDVTDTIQTCYMENTDIDYVFRYWGDK